LTVYITIRILPQLVKKTSIYTFCIAFIKALHQNKANLLESSTTPTESPDNSNKTSFEKLTDQCLNTAVLQWQTVVAQPAQPCYGSLHSTPAMTEESKIQRILELVELSLLTENLMPCKALFVMLLKVPGAPFDRFQTLYDPLIPRLKQLLRAKGTDVCSSPFAELLHLLIGTYLRDILGSKSCNVNTAIRKVGCGCAECNPVDAFLTSSSATEQLFRYVQARRTHVERQLSAASDLVKFETIRRGSPYGVLVTKRPEVVAASKWESRVARAKTFLRTIGDDNTISKLMGNRYADVLRALQGTQPFVLKVGGAAANASSCAGAPPNPSTGAAAPSSSVPAVAGTKRKKGTMVSSGPVIDLTGEESS
jgi:hypothetical protein